MARNHFDIERPRRICISIAGYDGAASSKARDERKAKEKARKQRATVVAQQMRVEKAVKEATVAGAQAHADLEQINQLCTSRKQAQDMSALMAAFHLGGGSISEDDAIREEALRQEELREEERREEERREEERRDEELREEDANRDWG